MLKPTLIATLRSTFEAWRKANDWSRETVAQKVVEAHEEIEADHITGIKFDPPTRDAFERMRVNADRLFRWLDDISKDRNHLPANMVPSLLAALPMDARCHAMDEILRPVGLGVRVIAAHGPDDSLPAMFRAMLREGAEADVAVSELLDGADETELLSAQRELTEDLMARQSALAWVEAQLAALRGKP
ncbi:MAG: hypothetical protein EG825_00655 [Rhodocyclaceae bacterium]|nr:hypothetical protein [Rhodocyclaceae bacterium]